MKTFHIALLAVCALSCTAKADDRADVKPADVKPANAPQIDAPPAEAKRAEPRPNLFDPARHMRVAEVKAGMKGYGLSVFRGTKIEKFEVEVISVMKNFNPKFDVILISCKGANLEHTGSVAGMSGSPIYLKDDEGKERMVGAYAYGWPLMKDPIAGVQPIEYMLKIPDEESDLVAGQEKAAKGVKSPDGVAPKTKMRWSFNDVVMLPGTKEAPASWPLAGMRNMKPNPRMMVDDPQAVRMRPLVTPMMCSGMSTKVLEAYEPLLRAYNIVPLQAGGGLDDMVEHKPDKLEPGSTLTVPMLTGDMNMAAIGTCTEVLGHRVYGFGHAFNNEGPIALPMGDGFIYTIIANLNTSFKLGAQTGLRGTLANDQIVGIAGRLGDGPPTATIQMRVTYADGSSDQTFNFNVALHPRFTPMLTAMAINAAISGHRDLPQYHTLDFDMQMEFANGEKVAMKNTLVNTSAGNFFAPGDVFREVGTPIIAAAENPFERVLLKKITGTVRVTNEGRDATILSVNVPKTKYQPGDTIKLFVTYRPFRKEEAILPLEFELPKELADGTYQLNVSDWETFMNDEQQVKPFAYSAESGKEVFEVLREITKIRHNALYMRLLKKSDGIAIGRTAMPGLPSSRRQVLIGAGLSDIVPFVTSTTKVVPTDYVMDGKAAFAITIDREGKVDTGKIKPVHKEPVNPKPDDAKPKAPVPVPAAPSDAPKD